MLELSDQLLQLIQVLAHLLFDVIHFQFFEAVLLFCLKPNYPIIRTISCELHFT